MKLSSNLTRFEPDILKKLNELEGKLSFDDVVSWILQFKPEDQSLATKLFLRIEYYGVLEIQKLCKALFSRLPDLVRSDLEHAVFVGVGGAADSSSMLLYHYRVNNQIPQSQFLEIDPFRELLRVSRKGKQLHKYLIFVDDFIGTGGQASSFLLVELKEIQAMAAFKYIGFHALLGFVDGIKNIHSETGIDVEVIYQLTDKNKVFHEASGLITKDYYVLQRVRDIIHRYGEKLYRPGPLGFGGNQSLVSFFYNTPNNTLPVIWARKDGWSPLLPRTESKPAYEVPDNEKLAIMLLTAIGGKCLYKEFIGFGSQLNIHPEQTIDAIKKRHIITVKDDGEDLILELTGKGHRESFFLFEGDIHLACEMVDKLRRSFENLLMKDLKEPQKDYNRLIPFKDKLVNLVGTACKVGEIQTILSLLSTTSWLLWRDHAIEERIRLGRLVLDSFEKSSLSTQYGYTKIDDIGWSEVVNENYDNAAENIEEGIQVLFTEKNYYGVCQGWRHLQSIKARKDNLVESEFGLRIVYGASCAIPNSKERVHQQAGIFRGLEKVTTTLKWSDRSNWYLRKYRELSNETNEHSHSEEAQQIGRAIIDMGKTIQTASKTFTLFLVRHPIAIKNSKQIFGRHMLSSLTPEGKIQVDAIVNKLHSIIPSTGNTNIGFFSGTYPVTRLMAEEISTKLDIKYVVDNSLDSINSGDLTGYSEDDAKGPFEEIMNKLSLYRNNKLDGFQLEFPSGESVRDLTMRLANFLLERVYPDASPQTCIIAGHCSSITAILNILTAAGREPLDSAYRYFDVPLGSITELTYESRIGKVSTKIR